MAYETLLQERESGNTMKATEVNRTFGAYLTEILYQRVHWIYNITFADY